MTVQFANHLSQNLSNAEMKLTEMQEDLALKNFSQCTLQLSSGDRFQTRNLKDQCMTHFCV